jgi:hypothetical protein
MSDSFREVGHVDDVTDGLELVVGVDRDTVTIGSGLTQWHLSRDQAEEFAQLFVRACWEAAGQDGAP